MKNSKSIVEPYLKKEDWRVKENSSSIYGFGGLNKYIIGEVSKDYWLKEVYPEEISKAYVDGHIHIHDLSGLSLYCCGYSLRDILLKGVRGTFNTPTSAPAKHFDSVLNQIANLLTIFQNEIMGAVALNSFDTLLAPFIKKDGLTYSEVKQNMQNYIYSINSNSRMGSEPAFSNLTFDLTPPTDLLDEYVIIGGELESFTYRSCQHQMDMLNKAFFEIMMEGDSKEEAFSYPIPTYNIHKRFDWDNPNNKLLWELTGKFGTPYFANYINSDMKPEDARSMCCRLRLDLTALRKRNGGLFGAGDSTGSIGVVTINLPRIAYESKGSKKIFYEKLDYYLDIAKDSLMIKRKWIQKNVIETNLIPAFIEYVGTIDNHFSTIGIIGMNEMCENFFGMGNNILTSNGKEFALEVGNYIRGKLLKYQEETGCLFNYEATPAESTSYRFALKDKKTYPDIITQGHGKDCYYTNSCHIPVNLIETIDSTVAHQEDLQTQFTGGTVIHNYLDGSISGDQAKSIIKDIFTRYKIPYMSISPISRTCSEHGYIEDMVDKCPICKKKLKLRQRITGYYRDIDNFNRGKKAEFKDRKQIRL